MLKNDVIYLEHIQKSLKRIVDYTIELSKEDFQINSMAQDAVIRQFEVVGEASKRISQEFKVKNPTLPWKDMAGMRNKLIHDYIDVDLGIVFTTARMDAPKLLNQINSLLR